MPTDEQIAADPYLAERYGVPSAWARYLGMAVVGAFVALVVGGFLYLGYRAAHPAVSASVIKWHSLGQHDVIVTFDIRKDPKASATCVVRALDQKGAEIGRQVVHFGPAATRATRHIYDLPITGKLNYPQVTDCQKLKA